MSQAKPLVINGWSIFAHPLFLHQIESLESQVEAQRCKDSVNYLKKNAAKRLAAILKLAFEVIPPDFVHFEHSRPLNPPEYGGSL